MATSTPWGLSQQSKSYGPGIVSYSCAGHGGFHVSPTLNATMPDYLRYPEGWYEEDCAWALVALAFPDRFTSKDLEHAKDTVRHYEPDIYEQHFGVILEPGESHVKDERAFNEKHKNDLIGVCASGDWKEGVPPGMVQVVAVRGGRGPCDASTPARETKTFLVPKADYDARGPHGFVVDPDVYAEAISTSIQ